MYIMITIVLSTFYLLVNLLFTTSLLALISNFFFLTKGFSRRSWNIRPTRTERFSRRPRTHRRTWSTRCKGNTRTWHFPFELQYFRKFLFIALASYPYVLQLFPQGLTGTPGVQGAEGKPGPLVILSICIF